MDLQLIQNKCDILTADCSWCNTLSHLIHVHGHHGTLKIYQVSQMVQQCHNTSPISRQCLHRRTSSRLIFAAIEPSNRYQYAIVINILLGKRINEEFLLFSDIETCLLKIDDKALRKRHTSYHANMSSYTDLGAHSNKIVTKPKCNSKLKTPSKSPIKPSGALNYDKIDMKTTRKGLK
jgi:hypothetical protein